MVQSKNFVLFNRMGLSVSNQINNSFTELFIQYIALSVINCPYIKYFYHFLCQVGLSMLSSTRPVPIFGARLPVLGQPWQQVLCQYRDSASFGTIGCQYRANTGPFSQHWQTFSGILAETATFIYKKYIIIMMFFWSL